MREPSTHPALDMSHTAMSEEDALRFLDGHRIRMGSRTMDPKAQIVGEFVKSIRVPGFFPPLPELRQQLRVMVSLMDEPAPALPRVEDIRIPGPAGEIPARVYAPSAGRVRYVMRTGGGRSGIPAQVPREDERRGARRPHRAAGQPQHGGGHQPVLARGGAERGPSGLCR